MRSSATNPPWCAAEGKNVIPSGLAAHAAPSPRVGGARAAGIAEGSPATNSARTRWFSPASTLQVVYSSSPPSIRVRVRVRGRVRVRVRVRVN